MSNLYTQTEKTFPEGAVFVTAHKEGYVCFAPMGGGFGYKLPEDQFFAEFRAVTEAEQQTASETYRAAMFEIDDLWPHPLPGFTNGLMWNGWSCPLFEKETVDILRSFEGFIDIEYDEETDTFIVDLGGDLDDDSRYQYSKGQDIEYAGTTKRVYVIGDGWVYSEVTADDE